jgi:hypothetical protein
MKMNVGTRQVLQATWMVFLMATISLAQAEDPKVSLQNSALDLLSRCSNGESKCFEEQVTQLMPLEFRVLFNEVALPIRSAPKTGFLSNFISREIMLETFNEYRSMSDLPGAQYLERFPLPNSLERREAWYAGLILHLCGSRDWSVIRDSGHRNLYFVNECFHRALALAPFERIHAMSEWPLGNAMTNAQDPIGFKYVLLLIRKRVAASHGYSLDSSEQRELERVSDEANGIPGGRDLADRILALGVKGLDLSKIYQEKDQEWRSAKNDHPYLTVIRDSDPNARVGPSKSGCTVVPGADGGYKVQILGKDTQGVFPGRSGAEKYAQRTAQYGGCN